MANPIAGAYPKLQARHPSNRNSMIGFRKFPSAAFSLKRSTARAIRRLICSTKAYIYNATEMQAMFEAKPGVRSAEVLEPWKLG